MSIENRDMVPRAAEREQRLHQAPAAARQMAKEASNDDHHADDQRHPAFGRLLAWLRRSSPEG